MDYSKLELRDEAFTKDKFNLIVDENGVLKTDPRPENLADYYNFGDYISHQSNKRTFTHRIYNLVKRRMFKTKFDLLREHQSKIETVLDFGCGTGDFLSYLETKEIKGEGVEPNETAFQKAKNNKVEVHKNLETIDEKFDAITLFHVLEHVDDYNKTLKELISKLNPKGLLLIAVPNYKSYDANYYKEKWAAWDVPRHLWHFNRENIKVLAEKHNLESIKIRPMSFDAFYISMISETYKGNSKAKGILRGLISNISALWSKEYSSNLFLLQKRS